MNFKLPRYNDIWPGKKQVSEFSIVGDMFCKKIPYDIDDRWLDEYRKIREYEPRLVEVYGYADRRILMQYIHGDTLRHNLCLDAFLEACDIMKNLAIYAKENLTYSEHSNAMGFWFHHDMAARNFMVEEKTNKVYLIDPDTFNIWINGRKEADILMGQYD